ncbi:MAG TPA: hypothetical protein PKV72_04440 [Candidatus Peribacteria bacterium]|nr:hypothetical protein [Candidatus Peribacteria bacterium]
MHTYTLPAERQLRVFTIGIATAACLYLALALLAEPVSGFLARASSATGSTVVSLTVVSTTSISCSTAVSITTATGATTGQYHGTGGTYAKCTVITTNSQGYTLRWLISTGSGGYGTGHLNSMNVTGGQPDRILAYKPATAGTPETFAAPNTANPATTSRWAARVKSASTTTSGAGKNWGTDGASEAWLNVGTGAQVSLVKRTTETTGDTELIQFKAYIGSTSAQPSGVYRATVVITANDNY